VRIETHHRVTTIDVRASAWGRIGFAASALLGLGLGAAVLHIDDPPGVILTTLFAVAFTFVGVGGFGGAVTHRIDRDASTIERVRRWGGVVVSRWQSALGGHAKVDVRLYKAAYYSHEVWLVAEAGETLIASTPSAVAANDLAERVRAVLR
jgi:hypothetical protein